MLADGSWEKDEGAGAGPGALSGTCAYTESAYVIVDYVITPPSATEPRLDFGADLRQNQTGCFLSILGIMHPCSTWAGYAEMN